MRRLTLDEVSQRLNGMVTKQAISKYERGLMNPSEAVLDALCNLYQASPGFLLGRKPVVLSDFSFRSKERTSKIGTAYNLSSSNLDGALFCIGKFF